MIFYSFESDSAAFLFQVFFFLKTEDQDNRYDQNLNLKVYNEMDQYSFVDFYPFCELEYSVDSFENIRVNLDHLYK